MANRPFIKAWGRQRQTVNRHKNGRYQITQRGLQIEVRPNEIDSLICALLLVRSRSSKPMNGRG